MTAPSSPTAWPERSRRPAAGPIHHGDRGVQYASAALAAHGLVASMSRTANPDDNAAMESFHSTLKSEVLYRAAVFDHIESFYNRRRPTAPPASVHLWTSNNNSARAIT